jgi:dTDP-4-amino-4,6-dideoxygalactose transaminase
MGSFRQEFREADAKPPSGDAIPNHSSSATGIGLNHVSMDHDNEPPVLQEPLFSPTALTIRGGQRRTARNGGFDFFWARNALYYGLRALGIQPGQKILVPAYLCTAAIEPIEQFGAEVQFYAVQRNCVPDWLDLETKMRGNVRAVMAVHYFGFPCDMEKFRALSKQYNTFLIEDCAHVLDGVPNKHRLGELGDFSIFSPRKFLPVFDGGKLRMNRPAPGFRIRLQFESPLFTIRVAKNLFERRKPPAASPTAAPPLEQHSKEGHSERELALAQGRSEKPLYVFPNSTSFLPWMANFPMSRLSRYLLPHFPLLTVAAKRRANYEYLRERVVHFQGVQPIFEQLGPGVVPWVLPLIVGDRPDAHKRLRALGIPAVTWGGVRDSRISASEFPDADFLYDRLVFLPIHQDLQAADLDRIAHAVAKVCRTAIG